MRISCAAVLLGLVMAVPSAKAWDRGDVDMLTVLPDATPGQPSSVEGLTVGPDGNIYVATFGFNAGGALTGNAVLYVAAVRDKVVPTPEWVAVAEDKNRLASPRWSPDGNLLYYISTRDGNSCVWAQRIDRAGKLAADPIAVFHSHHVPDLSGIPGATVGVTPNQLYLTLADVRGDIWTMMVERP